MNKIWIGATLTVLGACALACTGGSSSSSDDEAISCQYEVRSSGCNDYDYGEWEYDCSTLEYPADGVTPDSFCEGYSGSDTHCASDCCVNYQYQNAEGFYGYCSGYDSW